eukprot:2223393-Prymnesium_polylepis.1
MAAAAALAVASLSLAASSLSAFGVPSAASSLSDSACVASLVPNASPASAASVSTSAAALFRCLVRAAFSDPSGSRSPFSVAHMQRKSSFSSVCVRGRIRSSGLRSELFSRASRSFFTARGL